MTRRKVSLFLALQWSVFGVFLWFDRVSIAAKPTNFGDFARRLELAQFFAVTMMIVGTLWFAAAFLPEPHRGAYDLALRYVFSIRRTLYRLGKEAPDEKATTIQQTPSFKAAEANFLRAMKEEEQDGTPVGLLNAATALEELGFLYRVVNRFDDALRVLFDATSRIEDLALKGHQDRGIVALSAKTMFRIGEIKAIQGQIYDARQMLHKAGNLATQAGDGDVRESVDRVLALLESNKDGEAIAGRPHDRQSVYAGRILVVGGKLIGFLVGLTGILLAWRTLVFSGASYVEFFFGGVLLLPITYFLAPFYDFSVWGEKVPMLVVYGGGFMTWCLLRAGRKISRP